MEKKYKDNCSSLRRTITWTPLRSPIMGTTVFHFPVGWSSSLVSSQAQFGLQHCRSQDVTDKYFQGLNIDFSLSDRRSVLYVPDRQNGVVAFQYHWWWIWNKQGIGLAILKYPGPGLMIFTQFILQYYSISPIILCAAQLYSCPSYICTQALGVSCGHLGML